RNDPVRPIITTLAEAKRLGAMALFGEKYGEVVRMVEVGEGEYSRELCGGTHVQRTAEIGLFRILSESSSAANVRGMEAVTGPAAVQLLREHDQLLGRAAAELRTRPERLPEVVRARELERRELERSLKSSRAQAEASAVDLDSLLAAVANVDGVPVLASAVQVPDREALLDLVDRLRGRLGEAAIVLGSAGEGAAHLVVSLSPALVREHEVQRVVVGLPLSLRGHDTEQTRRSRAFAEHLAARLEAGVQLELHDERFTTRIAQRLGRGSAASEDSRAAAHLLEDWL